MMNEIFYLGHGIIIGVIDYIYKLPLILLIGLFIFNIYSCYYCYYYQDKLNKRRITDEEELLEKKNK